MEKGSTVECIRPELYDLDVKANTPYTVSNIFICPCGCNTPIVNLEEVKGPIDSITGLEHGFDIEDLKELLPPLDVSKLLEEVIYETV